MKNINLINKIKETWSGRTMSLDAFTLSLSKGTLNRVAILLIAMFMIGVQGVWGEDVLLASYDFTNTTNFPAQSITKKEYKVINGVTFYGYDNKTMAINNTTAGVDFGGQNIASDGRMGIAIPVSNVNGTLKVVITHNYNNTSANFKYGIQEGTDPQASSKTWTLAPTNSNAVKEKNVCTFTKTELTKTQYVVWVGESSSSYKVVKQVDIYTTASSSPSTKTVYLDLSGFTDWEGSSAAFRIWDDDGKKNIDMTKVNTDCSNSHLYSADVPSTSKNLYFKRCNSDYSSDWNQVSANTFDVNNKMSVTGWSAGTAGTYTPSYSVTFDANGKGDNPATQCVTSGGTATDPEWKYLGYTCTWKKGGADYNFSTAVTENTELTASWTAVDNQTIYLDKSTFWQEGYKVFVYYWNTEFAGNGSVEMTAANTCDVNVLKAEIPSNANSVIFVQMKSGQDSFSWDQKNNQTGDVTLGAKDLYKLTSATAASIQSANFTPSKFTVTFDANGHGTAPDAQANIACGGKATSPTAPSATGYTFGGWFKEAGCTNAWTFASDQVSANTTLYAKWTVNQHTLAWNLAGGSVQTAGTAAGTVDYGTTVTAPTVTRTGYTFSSWSPAVVSPMPDEDKSYTAQWTAKTYTITLDANTANHGTGQNKSATATYDSNTLTNYQACSGAAGYTLTGYFTDATEGTKVMDATGALVASVDSYTDASGNWVKDAAVTLYAQYAEGSAETVIFDYVAANAKSTTAPTNGASLATSTYGTLIVGQSITAQYKTTNTIDAATAGYFKLGNNDVAIEITLSGTTFAVGDVITITGKNGGSGDRNFEIGRASVTDAGTSGNISTSTRSDQNEGTFTATITEAWLNGDTPASLRIFRKAGNTMYLKAITVTRPGAAAPYTWQVYGNFVDNTNEHWAAYDMTNGVATITNVPRAAHLLFKLRKTNDGGTNYLYYGAQNESNEYKTSEEDWTLTSTNEGYDIKLTTGAKGSYVITASAMNTDAPHVTVTYPAAYTVSYDGNGATSGEMATHTLIAANEQINLTANAFVKTGYTFNGWKDGDAKTYTDAQENVTITKDLTLTAQWMAVLPVISVDPVSATYFQGKTATALSVTATLSDGTIGYQWQKSTDNSNWSDITGETNATYTPSTAETGTFYYRCVVKNTTASSQAVSSAATITVNAIVYTYSLYGNFSGEDAMYDLTEGAYTAENLAKETTYDFKVKRVGDDESEVWFGATADGNSYTTSGTQWKLDGTFNVHMLTGAKGNYVINVVTTGANPQITVTYPTSYTITYAGGDGATGSMTSQVHIAPGEKVNLTSNTFVKTGYHFTGWKDASDNDYTDGQQVTVTGNIDLTAQWEKAVTDFTVSAPDNATTVVVGETLQLSVALEPADATYGTDIIYSSSNSSKMTVSSTGLVTGVAKATGEYINVTVNGIVKKYYINVLGAACEDAWQVHMWNTGASTNTRVCLAKVGETTEWRSEQVQLPSNSDNEKLKVLFNGVAQTYSAEWTTRWLPMVDHGGDQIYPGNDAVGYFRIFSDATTANYNLAFEPIYIIMHGVDGQSGWLTHEFAATATANLYQTNIVKVPAGYFSNDNYKFYVGTKRAAGSSESPFVSGHDTKADRSLVTKLNGMGNLTTNREGQYGKYQIYNNSSDKNWYCSFVPYLAYELRDDADNLIYYETSATESATTIYNGGGSATLPTKTGYTLAGWARSVGGAKVLDLGAAYNFNNSLPLDILYPVWTANQYSITYKESDGSAYAGSNGSSLPATHTYGTSTALVDGVRDGYTFNGWYTEAGLTNKVTSLTATAYTANITLYAKWTADAPAGETCVDLGYGATSENAIPSNTTTTVNGISVKTLSALQSSRQLFNDGSAKSGVSYKLDGATKYVEVSVASGTLNSIQTSCSSGSNNTTVAYAIVWSSTSTWAENTILSAETKTGNANNQAQVVNTSTAPANAKSVRIYRDYTYNKQAYGQSSSNYLFYINVCATNGSTPEKTDPTVTFNNGNYTIGGAALDLSSLFSSNSDGAVTYTVTNANGTGATISDGTSFTATTAGTATVQASQAATSTYNAKVVTATITVSAASPEPGGDCGEIGYGTSTTIALNASNGDLTLANAGASLASSNMAPFTSATQMKPIALAGASKYITGSLGGAEIESLKVSVSTSSTDNRTFAVAFSSASSFSTESLVEVAAGATIRTFSANGTGETRKDFEIDVPAGAKSFAISRNFTVGTLKTGDPAYTNSGSRYLYYVKACPKASCDGQDAELAFGTSSVNKTTTDVAFTNTLTNSHSVAVTYSSSNTTIATVNASTGEVTIVAPGTVTIKATAAEQTVDGTKYCADEASYTLKITKAAVPVTSINVSLTKSSIMATETTMATAVVTPDNADNKTYTWSSSNTSVATVDQSGNVTGVAAGTANIIATAKDGSGVSGQATVTVAAATYKVTYDATGTTNGTVPTDDTNYASGATVTVKGNTGNLAKDGYTFDGWNTAADGSGTDYSAGSTFSITANTTLYAQWAEASAEDCQTIFSAAYKDASSMTATVGSVVVNSPSSQSTYKSIKLNSSGYIELTPAAGKTFAVGDKLTVTLMVGATSAKTLSFKTASTSGSTYSHSATTQGGKTQDIQITLVAGDITDGKIKLYRGSAESYFVSALVEHCGTCTAPTLTWTTAPTGGAVGDADKTILATANSGGAVTYSTEDEDVATIVDGKLHYVGAGTTTVTATVAANGDYCEKSISQEITVTANYTLTYNVNGGTGTAPTAAVGAAGATVTLATGTGLSKEGFTFDGWNSAADGSGTTYAAGAEYTLSGNVTLYAKWLITADYCFTMTAKAAVSAAGDLTNGTQADFTGGTVNSSAAMTYDSNKGWKLASSVIAITLPNKLKAGAIISVTYSNNGTGSRGVKMMNASTAAAATATQTFINAALVTNQKDEYTIKDNDGFVGTKVLYFVRNTSNDTYIKEIKISNCGTACTTPTTLTWTATPASGAKGGTMTIGASATGNTGAITYRSSNTAVATVDGTTLTYVDEGTATIYAEIEEQGDYCDASISQEITVSVTKYALKVTDPETTCDKNLQVAAGKEVTIENTCEVDGKVLIGYTESPSVSGVFDPNTKTFTFTMPAEAVTLTAQWGYPIATVTPAGGSFTVKNGSKTATAAVAGATITLTPKANTGYNFSAWNVYKTGDESTKVTVTTNTFTMPAYGVTVEATFTLANPVTGVTLDKSSVSGNVGGSTTLVATVTPAEALNKNVTWSSSDEAVATVDQNGKVLYKGTGTATITVTTEEGGHQATCAVTVEASAACFSLTNVVKVVSAAGDLTDQATIVGGGATAYQQFAIGNNGFKFSNSGDVLKITMNNALAEGSVITIKFQNGGDKRGPQIATVQKSPSAVQRVQFVTSSGAHTESFTIPEGSEFIGKNELYIMRANNAFYLQEISVTGCSGSVVITPCTKPVVTDPEDQTICEGGTATAWNAANTADLADGESVAYSWKNSEGTEVATTATYTPTVAGKYTCEVTISATSKTSSSTVVEATLIINTKPATPSLTTPYGKVTTGSEAVFTATTTGATGYEWQYSTDNSSWNDLTDTYGTTNGNKMNTSTTLAEGTYYYKVRATNACGTSEYSNVVSIQVIECSGVGTMYTLEFTNDEAQNYDAIGNGTEHNVADIATLGTDNTGFIGYSNGSATTTVAVETGVTAAEKQLKFATSRTYLEIGMPCMVREGDIITFEGTNEVCFTTTTSYNNGIQTSGKTYTVPHGSPLVGASSLYVWRAADKTTYLHSINIFHPEGYATVPELVVTSLNFDEGSDYRSTACKDAFTQGDVTWTASVTNMDEIEEAGETVTYLWTREGTTNTVANASWTPAVAGTYTVTATVHNSNPNIRDSKATKSLQLRLLTAPEKPTITIEKAEIVSGENVVLMAEGINAEYYHWYRDADAEPMAITTEPRYIRFVPNYELAADEDHDYYVITSNTNPDCNTSVASETVHVVIHPIEAYKPVIVPTNNGACSSAEGDDRVKLVAEHLDAAATAKGWYKDGVAVAGDCATPLYPTESGTYVLKQTVGGVEYSSDELNVTVGTAPVVAQEDLGSVDAVAGNNVTFHSGITGADIYRWYQSRYPDYRDASIVVTSAPNHTFYMPGYTPAATYYCKVEGVNDCGTATAHGIVNVTAASCSKSDAGFYFEPVAPKILYSAAGTNLPFKNPNNVNVKFVSAIPVVAQVDQSGHVTHASVGTTVIMAQFDGNSKYCPKLATCTLTIVPPDEEFDVTIDQDGDQIVCGSSIKLTAYPEDANVYQWYRNGVKIEGATAQTYQATLGGKYDVVVTKTFPESSQSKQSSEAAVITDATNFKESIVDRLTEFHSYRNGCDYTAANDNPVRHLYRINAQGTTGAKWKATVKVHTSTGTRQLTNYNFIKTDPTDPNVVICDMKTLAARNAGAGFAKAGDTLEVYIQGRNSCNGYDSPSESVWFYVTEKDTRMLAYIVSGADDEGKVALGGDFLTGYNKQNLLKQTGKSSWATDGTMVPMYDALANHDWLITVPVNGYADFDLYNYEPFDVLLLTDHVKTSDGGSLTDAQKAEILSSKATSNQKKNLRSSGFKVNDLAQLVDYRPTLSLKIHMAALKAWANVGFSENPVAVKQRKNMYVLCKDHKLFESSYAVGNYVKQHTTSDGLVEMIMATENGFDDGKVIQGFSISSPLTGFINIAVIPNHSEAADNITTALNNNNLLIAACERQQNMAARFFLTSINADAMSKVNETGIKIFDVVIDYLLKPNASDASDCAITYSYNDDPALGADHSWYNTNNWTIGAVPMTLQNVRIADPVYIQKDRPVTASFVKIVDDPEHDGNGAIIIEPGATLDIIGQLGMVDKEAPVVMHPIENPDLLVIKSDAVNGNGALVHNDKGTNKATVEMYSKATGTPDGNGGLTNVTWQWMTTPFLDADPALDHYQYAWMYAYNNESHEWNPMVGPYDALAAFKGYCITQEAAKTYSMQGTLASTADQTINLSTGINLIGNSWTAPIDITKMKAADFTNAYATIVMFNTGLDVEGSGTVVKGANRTAGQYVAVPVYAASSMNKDVQAIPSMQAFQVKAYADGAKVALKYNQIVRQDSAKYVNITPMYAPGRGVVAAEAEDTDDQEVDGIRRGDIETLKIMIDGQRYGDEVYLFAHENFTDGFDNGWDGEKIRGNSECVQLFARSGADRYAVSAQPTLVGTRLATYKGEDDEYTISFDYRGSQKLWWYDTKTDVYTAIDNESTYTYSTNTGALQTRFMITDVNPNIPDNPIVTDLFDVETEEGEGLIFRNTTGKEMTICIYDAAGRLLSKQLSTAPMVNLSLPEMPGVYMINAKAGDKQITRKVAR